MITHEELLGRVVYNKNTGEFTRKIRTRKWKSGQIMGGIKDGHRRIQLDGILYYAHRLAWFFVNEKWPDEQIDHINRNRDDNRIDNLREATHAQNTRNKKPQGVVPYKGVYLTPKCNYRYRAEIKSNGKKTRLGKFESAVVAALAYDKAAKELYGEFARLNFPVDQIVRFLK